MTYKALRYCLQTLGKNNSPPTFSHGEGRWSKGLRTTIQRRYCNHKFDKINPTHPFHLKGWAGQKIIINEIQYVTSINMCMRFNNLIYILLFQHRSKNYIFLLCYHQNNFLQIHLNSISIYCRCFPNVFTHLHLFLNNFICN